MNPIRMFKHLLAPPWLAQRAFPSAALQAIEAAVKAAEQRHAGELRFVVETGLSLSDLWRDISARARAMEIFSNLRVWDTQHNSGVLIYVQLIDRSVEIVADRGISARVGQAEWDAICRNMEAAFRGGAYLRGALEAVEMIGQILATNFPGPSVSSRNGHNANNLNELPDRPVLL